MPSSPSPKVSVIVPCYNLGAYLDEAVVSVLEQTYQNFEVVVVNDGSTDPETNRLLAGYRRPKTRVIQSDNRGLAAARNLAIEHSLGEYLCALDADDKLAPTFLEKTTRILDDDSVTFVSCWLQTFGANEWVWKQDRWDFPTLLGECTVATPALVRKAAVLEVGCYDANMGVQGYEDWDLWISLVEEGFRGAILPEVLFYYRQREGSMSETCCTGEAHLSLMRYMVNKHTSSYREHLLEILVQKEGSSCDLLRTTYALDREVAQLTSRIQDRREELDRLHHRLDAVAPAEAPEAPDARIGALERELSESRREADELRAAVAEAHDGIAKLLGTKSWRVTAPLRAAFNLLDRLPGARRDARDR